MKQAGPLLVLLVWPGTLLAESSEIPTRTSTKVSAYISAMIRAELPGYAPQIEPPPATSQESSPALTRDPDVLELPKITVREKPPARIDPLDILSKGGRKKKLAHDFKNSFTGLDGVLNGFSFPIFSPSMAERGRVNRQQQQLEELNRVARAIREDDPKTAAALQKNAADTQRALDRQNRPAGSK